MVKGCLVLIWWFVGFLMLTLGAFIELIDNQATIMPDWAWILFIMAQAGSVVAVRLAS